MVSYYAMSKVVEDNKKNNEKNPGRVVYCAPTKALVMQMAAEMEARKSTCMSPLHSLSYTKNKPTLLHSLWCLYT
jgi:superfamily II RNA helicase